jgi:hypothetical protein
MKLALLIFGIFATGLGTLIFACLAIASSMAEDMANTLSAPAEPQPTDAADEADI